VNRRYTALAHGTALLAAGMLAGALGYGAANLVPAFDAVPLALRLDFHTALMERNGITVQGAMAVSALSTGALAVLSRGTARRTASAAGLLVLGTFLITRFGNVPVNGRIREWAAVTGPVPADHARLLERWELFHLARTGTAVAAFALLVLLALRRGERKENAPAPAA
jgi:uncharacterized membrane protein